MDTDKYRLLLRIVDVGNLTKAAASMNYTQSAASHTIASIEKKLGFQILSRGRSGAKLTAEGEQILPAIREAVASEDKVFATAGAIAGLHSGILRVSAFTSVCLCWLPALTGIFHQIYPNVTIQIISGQGSYNEMERFLADRQSDCSFICTPVSRALRIIPLIEDPLCAVLPPDHPLAAQDSPITFAQLEGEPFLMPSENNNSDIQRLFTLHGYTPNVAISMHEDLSLISLAENGLGFTIMPRLLLKHHAHTAAVRPLEGSPTRSICIATRANETPSPLVESFIRLVQENIRRL